MINQFSKQKTFSFLAILALIINVSISGISNSSLISFLMKLISSTILFAIFFIHLHLSNISLTTLFTSKDLKKTFVITTALILYLGITLIYSSNPYYGAQKIINIIVSAVPNIIVLYFLITIGYKENYSDYLLSIIAVGFVLILVPILLLNPFDHSTSYQLSPLRWSHVFIGRMVSFLSLIVFFYLISVKEFSKIIIYAAVFIIGIYLTYLTGLRSALIGLVLCSVISFGWFIYKKNLSSAQFYSIISVLVIIVTLILFTTEKFPTTERLGKILKIENLDFGGDQPILTRVESYKLSWQMFKEHPFAGYGFGSFNGFNNIEWTRMQKYPHNILLEILSELGLFGLLIFGWLFADIIISIRNVKYSMINGQSEVSQRDGMPKSLPKGWQAKKLKVKSINTLKSFFSQPLASNSLTYGPQKTQITTYYSPHTTHFLLLTFLFSLFLAMFSKDISTQGLLWLFVVFLGRGKT